MGPVQNEPQNTERFPKVVFSKTYCENFAFCVGRLHFNCCIKISWQKSQVGKKLLVGKNSKKRKEKKENDPLARHNFGKKLGTE